MPSYNQKIDLMIYWDMLWRHKWVVIITGLVFTVLGLYMALTSVPVYEASATILLREIDLESRTVERFAPEVRALTDFSTLRAKILSPENLRRLIEQAALKDDSLLNKLAEATHRDNPYLSLEDIKLTLAIQKLRQKTLKIKPNGANMIQIAAQHSDPRSAYKIVKTLVQIFIEQSRRTELSGVETGLAFSRSQMAIYKKNLEEAETQWQRFKAGAAISQLSSTAMKDERIENLRAIIFSTSTQLERERATFAAANDHLGLDKSAAHPMVASPLLDELFQQQCDKLDQLTTLLVKNNGNEEEINRTNSDIKALDASLQTEVQRLLDSQSSWTERPYWLDRTMAEYRSKFLDKKKEKVQQLLDASLESRKASASSVPLQALTEERLKKEVDQARELYEMFLRQAQGSEMKAALQNAQSEYQYRILEPAQIPLEPISMGRRNKLMIFCVLGGGLGIMLAFGLEYLNRAFMKVEEVGEYLQLPVVGIMPKLERKDFIFDLEGKDAIEIQRVTTTIMKHLPLKDLLGEDFSSEQQKTMLVTSSIVAEGKSTFAAYLATSLAMLQDWPVLLIDSDLRRPNLHRLFKVANHRGLSNLVEQEECLDASPYVPTGYKKLSLLLGGQNQRTPLELFTSKQFARTLDEIKKDFPFIIIDAPPVIPVNDALILGRYADAIFYVIKAGFTPRDVVKRGVELIKNSCSHVPGIILNNVREVLPYYYKQNYYKYKYGYHSASNPDPLCC